MIYLIAYKTQMYNGHEIMFEGIHSMTQEYEQDLFYAGEITKLEIELRNQLWEKYYKQAFRGFAVGNLQVSILSITQLKDKQNATIKGE